MENIFNWGSPAGLGLLMAGLGIFFCGLSKLWK